MKMKVENPNSGWLSPGALITLAKIMRFAAGPLFACLSGLERHTRDLSGDDCLSEKQAKQIKELLDEAWKCCFAIQHHSLTFHVSEIKERMKEPCSAVVIRTEIEGLERVILRELENITFVSVSQDKAQFFQNPALFGKDVDAKFSSARIDIKESGNCLALERYDACVFHSMRVLEHGLLAMAERINGAKMKDLNWSAMIKAIEDEIGRRDKGNRTPKWKREREFFIAGALHSRYLKDSWRNYVMHVTDVHYEPTEARMVFEHARDLMQHLATKLKERR